MITKTSPNVTHQRGGSDILNLALGIHAAADDQEPIDICTNKGVMWRGLAYTPLRCDIDIRHPWLDIVSDWKDLPNFTGAGRVLTVVGDLLFMHNLGKNSAYRHFATELNVFDDDVMAQVADMLRSAKAMLDPLRGTFILKIGDSVMTSRRQFYWYETLKLADAQGWLKCDEYVEDGANMSDPKRLHRYHLDSQVRWLVLHNGTECPGPGLTLPGRARCAHCNRVVACKRVRKETYCRPPRGCKQAAYRERLASR